MDGGYIKGEMAVRRLALRSGSTIAKEALAEAWLLLVENLSQYPAMRTWKTVRIAIFGGHYGG